MTPSDAGRYEAVGSDRSVPDDIARLGWMDRIGADPRRAPVEWLFALVVLAGVLYAGVHAHQFGYLPQPFFVDASDTYGDGYNTVWWGHHGSLYDVWGTIYPPFAFVLTNLLSDPRCYSGDVLSARDCDWLFWWMMILFMALNAIIALKCYRRQNRWTALPRTIALIAGLPMLFLLDRLNILIVGFTGMFLAFGSVTRSAWLRWLGIAVAINLKPYFAPILLGQLLIRRWRWVEGALFVTIALGLFSWLVIGEGSPMEIYRNIADFSSNPDRAGGWTFIVYAASYDSLKQFLDSSFPLALLTGSHPVELGSALIPIVIAAVQAVSLASFVAIWLNPGAISRARLTALCYMFVIISVEPGGYAMAGAIFLVMFEEWRGPARITALVSAYVLSMPIDYSLSPLSPFTIDAYLGGRPVVVDYGVTLGPFLRPGLIIAMQLALIAATFGDIRRHRAWPGGRHLPATMPTSNVEAIAALN